MSVYWHSQHLVPLYKSHIIYILMYIHTVINILVDNGLVKAFNSKLEETSQY